MSAGEAFSVPRIVSVGHTTLGNHLDIQNITSVGHITNSATDKLENILGGEKQNLMRSNLFGSYER